MLAIQKGNHNFGTTSHCRVPLRLRAAQVSPQALWHLHHIMCLVMAALVGGLTASISAADAIMHRNYGDSRVEDSRFQLRRARQAASCRFAGISAVT